jgi:hypothetical protein
VATPLTQLERRGLLASRRAGHALVSHVLDARGFSAVEPAEVRQLRQQHEEPGND